jgi:hypothetical protein
MVQYCNTCGTKLEGTPDECPTCGARAADGWTKPLPLGARLPGVDLIAGSEQETYIFVDPDRDTGSIVLRQGDQRVDIPLAELDRIVNAMKALGRNLGQESAD